VKLVSSGALLASLCSRAALANSQCLASSVVGKQSSCPALHFVKMVHTKCRGEVYKYGNNEVARLPVPEDKVSWSVEWAEYAPQDFTAPFVQGKEWADPDLGGDFNPEWNSLDKSINRVSHEGPYQVQGGRPLNIRGRTGLAGRGVLGKWGPNHAADPIVTRWQRGEDGQVVSDKGTGKQVLEFVAIQRKDTGAWAIPGGMVDPGEKVSVTVKREFMEEALDSTGAAKENVGALTEMVDKFFEGGEEVYRGYVDDPRNTDNSWMETVAFNFHDPSGQEVGQLPLQAGDDAGAIQWMPLDAKVILYASHKDFVEKVVEKLGAHW